jgi:hypothetical protein
MNSSLQSLKENGKALAADRFRDFYRNSLYKKITATLWLVDQDWLAGTWKYTETQHPELFARIKELENTINDRYFNIIPDIKAYQELVALIAAWGSALKEMVFLHRSHLEGQAEKNRQNGTPAPRSSSTEQPRPLPGLLTSEDQPSCDPNGRPQDKSGSAG